MKNSELELQRISIDDYKENMDDFNVGLFNTWQWVNSLTNEFTEDIYFHITKNGEIIGKACGFLLNQKRKGKHLYITGGPNFKEWEAGLFKESLALLHGYALKEGFARVHIRPFEQVVHEVLDIDNYFRTVAREYVIDYSEHVDKVKFSYGFKQNAKKARKAGAEFKSTRSAEVLDRLIELMDNTRLTRKEKYGQNYDPMYMLNLNKDTLTKLLDTGMGIMHYAEIAGEIHSVQFNLEHDGKIFGLLMGSDDDAYSKGIPSFIDQNISEKAMKENARYYNLGTVPLDREGGQGLRKYKESQSGREIVRYGYYSYFLIYPNKLLNPFIKLSKKLPDNKIINLCRKLIRIFNFQ